MSVCPRDYIKITSRDISFEDISPLQEKDKCASYDALLAILTSRRSIRNLKDEEVEPELIAKIIDAVSTAPIGIPPNDVEVLVLDSRLKVKEFGSDILNVAKRTRWFFSPIVNKVLRPVMGREYFESVENFIRPAVNIFIEEKAKGNDYLLYDAPLAMYFYCSAYADPAIQ